VGPTGLYTLAVGGTNVDAFCDQQTDLGGWTLIASFVNNDGARHWSTLDAFQNPELRFGTLDARDSADYKSATYGAIVGDDILIVTDEYAFAFHAVLNNQTFSSFMTNAWPSSCSTSWLREGADFTQGLTTTQAALLGMNLRANDPNENACFPLEEASALAFIAGDVQNNGLGNSPTTSAWGALDLSLPNLANFTTITCTPPVYPCNSAGWKKPFDDFGASVKAQRALLFVR